MTTRILAIVAAGMLATASAAPAATVTVMQDGFTFSPAEITIDVGDTVEWVWNSGSHTVTNGTGPDDPDVGTLFDETLDSASTLVSYTFTEAGDVPYFCRPHYSLGMTGVVKVVDPTPPDDPTWSRVKTLYR